MVRLIVLAGLFATALATTTTTTTSSAPQPGCSTSSKVGSCVPIPLNKKAQKAADCTNTNKQEQATFCPFEVDVGSKDGAILKYFPEEPDEFLCPGRRVKFNFNPKNHTVTESTFAEPCKPLPAGAARPGIRTGFVPVSANDTTVKFYTVEILDTKPIWLFCGQKPHCQKGMVMAINVNKDDPDKKDLNKYRSAAMAVPTDGSSTTTTTSAAAITPAPSPTTTTTDSPGPILGSPTSSTTRVSVFTGAAAPTNAPRRFAAVGGLAIAGAVALL